MSTTTFEKMKGKFDSFRQAVLEKSVKFRTIKYGVFLGFCHLKTLFFEQWELVPMGSQSQALHVFESFSFSAL